jgi:hypothetical protein
VNNLGAYENKAVCRYGWRSSRPRRRWGTECRSVWLEIVEGEEEVGRDRRSVTKSIGAEYVGQPRRVPGRGVGANNRRGDE